MTYAKLKYATARLGFENDIEDDGVLLAALSRAIHTLYIDRPTEVVTRVVKPRYDGTLLFSSMTHKPGKTEEFRLDGRAFSMILSGSGRFTIISDVDGDEDSESFSGANTEIRRIIQHPATIRFEGDLAYDVISLTVYPSYRSGKGADVPLYDERCELSLSDAIPDFLALAAPVCDGYGNEIPGVRTRADRLILPDGYHGELLITYCRAPTMPSGADPDEELDIPRDSEELIPLLTASFVWLEDEPEIAQYYRALYSDGIASLRRNMPGTGSSEYVTNGWA